ncbi:hypothetical protein IWQ56_003489, partial [Coemansia nantahalensis]
MADLAAPSPFSQPPAGSTTPGALSAPHPPSPGAATAHVAQPPPREKTAVGRSGVFEDTYGSAGELYHRRHSLDMGASPQYSPPHTRRPPGGLSPTAAGLQYGASRSGGGSPHPLSVNQAYGARGAKRSPGDDDDDDDEEEDDDDDLSDSDGSSSPVEGRAPGVPTAEKPYACDQCELTFSRQHNLKSHALTHSSERPFSCEVCQTPFRRQHDLKRHMKLHTGEKPFKCTNCGRSFARLDALNRHMRAENFHACNQAAKKARTGDIKPLGFLDQRRASHNPPGVSPPWAHWTHRPSMAADEAMLRRMHERFGAPPPPPAGAQQAPMHHHPPQTAPHQHYPPYYAASRPAAAAAAAPAGYGPASDPRAYAAGGHPTAPAQPHYPHHQPAHPPQSQPPAQTQYGSAPSSAAAAHLPAPHMPPPSALPGHAHAAGESGAMPSPPHHRPHPHHHQQLAAPEHPRYAPGARTGGGDRAPWHPPPLGPPPQSHVPAGPGARGLNLPPPHHAPLHPMRLPPMELAPTRRHSLAVTSHLERYRAQDATPPPLPTPPQHQQQQFQQPQSAKPPAPEPSQSALSPLPPVLPVAAAPRLTLSGPSPPAQAQPPTKSHYMRPQLMEPLHEDHEPAAAPPVPAAAPAEASMSRRPSHESAVSTAGNTRRSSIIALTNPQSEEDVRAENAELKRRLDEMEAKYLAEVARLTKA